MRSINADEARRGVLGVSPRRSRGFTKRLRGGGPFEQDGNYYTEWYAKAGRDLSDDPSGVASFVLWEYQGCGDAQASKGPSVQDRNCDVAQKLEICITNRSFEVEPLQCLRNLKARRDEFLQRVAEPPTR